MQKSIFDWILSNPFILVVFTVVLLNYVSGIIKNIKLIWVDIKKGNYEKLIDGLLDLIQKLFMIVILILSHILFNRFEIEILTEGYKFAFYFLVVVIISYHANSILVNVAHVFGFKDLVLLKNLDDYLKSLMGKSIEVK